MKTGIYCIKNNVTNKVYIGKAKSLSSRKSSHKWALRNNKHVNVYLQHSWNKYGEDSFCFIIIEYCSVEELSTKEQYWVNFYNATNSDHGYNLMVVGRQTYEHSSETKEKMRRAHLGKKKSYEHCKNLRNKSKPVLQFDKNGNFIQEWKGASFIKEELGFNPGHISSVCNGYRKSSNGFIWKYKN